MNDNRYRIELIDLDGTSETVAQMDACDTAFVLDKLVEISATVARPGHRIRVKDENGESVFVGLMTRHETDSQHDRVA